LPHKLATSCLGKAWDGFKETPSFAIATDGEAERRVNKFKVKNVK
jgi:hypothetical protein